MKKVLYRAFYKVSSVATINESSICSVFNCFIQFSSCISIMNQNLINLLSFHSYHYEIDKLDFYPFAVSNLKISSSLTHVFGRTIQCHQTAHVAMCFYIPYWILRAYARALVTVCVCVWVRECYTMCPFIVFILTRVIDLCITNTWSKNCLSKNEHF